MSIALMSAAFKTALSSTHKFVFVALCDNANDQGECFPSVAMLAEKTSLSDRAVQKSLAYLCDAGFVLRNARNGRSTYYTITAPSGWKVPAPEQGSPQPRATFTPEPDSPPNAVHPAPEPSSPPPPNVVHPTPEHGSPITIKEPSIEPPEEPPKKARKKSDDENLSCFNGIDAKVVADFRKLRKAKSAPVTETAMEGIIEQAKKAGLTLEGALRICCERGWAGFKAEWLTRGDDRRGAPRGTQDRRESRHSGFDQLDYEKGVSDDGRF